MKTTKDLLANKGNQIYSVHPQQTALEAAKIMAEKGIGGLLVLEDGHLVGIITERDYIRKTYNEVRQPSEISIAEIMVADVQCASSKDTVTDCMEIMTAGKFRHLPVKDGDELLGVLSIGDLVKATIGEQQEHIQQLEQFISS